MADLRPCILIPTYENPRTLEGVVRDALTRCPDVIVVDDGSGVETSEILARIEGITVLRHEVNQGKGAALRTGLAEAQRRGFTHALSMDSDGQHLGSEVPRLLEAARAEPGALILGSRDLQAAGAGPGSKFGRVNSNFWVWVATGERLPDTQTGMRVYPVAEVCALQLECTGYDLEVEVLVKAAWSGIPLRSVPVEVRYFQGDERVSHLHPVWDFVRIGRLDARFVAMRICLPAPYLALRASRRFHQQPFWRRWRETFVDWFVREPGPSWRVAASVALGLFWAVAPVWGFQIALTLLSAHLLRLSKPLAVLASNLSVPPVAAVLIPTALLLGRAALHRPQVAALALESEDVAAFLLGSVLLGLLLALTGGLLTYLGVAGFRRLRPATRPEAGE